MKSCCLAFLVGGVAASAEPPAHYYDAAQGKAGHALFESLHTIISGHHVIPYSSSTKFDTSDALKVLDQSPADSNLVVMIYSGSNEPASSFGLNTGWNREHQWCDSYGLDGVEPAYSDLFNLRAVDLNVNSARGNKYYDFSDTNSVSYKSPAHTEAPFCTTDSDSWQPPTNERGEIARSLFYMATRYTGDKAGEPHLILTDNASLIQSTNSYMGKLSTALAWSRQDPVEDVERLRNERIYSLYQTNRNPFIDHPEWVDLVFSPAHTNPPVLNSSILAGQMTLSWLATNQSCRVEFSTNLSGAWEVFGGTPVLTNGNFSLAITNNGAQGFFRLAVY